MSQLKRRLDAIEASPPIQQAANRRRFFELVEQAGIEKYSEIAEQHPELEPLPAGVEIYVYTSHPNPALLEPLPPEDVWRVIPLVITTAQAESYTEQFKALGCRCSSACLGDIDDPQQERTPPGHKLMTMHAVYYAAAD